MQLKRKEYIKLYLTKEEKKDFKTAVKRLREHSPTLSGQRLLRLMLKNLDRSMIEFLELEQNHPIKIQLHTSSVLKQIELLKD